MRNRMLVELEREAVTGALAVVGLERLAHSPRNLEPWPSLLRSHAVISTVPDDHELGFLSQLAR
jgi:hypothetical protein